MNCKQIMVVILAVSIIPIFGYSKEPQKQIQISNSKLHTIDSSYGWVDSILIEYYDAVDVVTHYVTFNRNTIKVTSDQSHNKIFTNSDTVRMMINYVEALFISGREKTELGRSYSKKLVYTGSDYVKIRLFANGDNYSTHEIYTQLSNGDIEFSETFLAFNNFLKKLIDYYR